jgi:fructan beta-fructosidase
MHCSPPLHSPLHSPSLLTADDILIADFEGENYAPWLVTGEAFGPGPACGTLPGQMEVSGFKGRGLVNTFFNGDDTTGTLTSPEFQIQRKFIAFLVGGGRNTEKLALQLLIEGQVVRNATGQNDLPGGSEALAPESWHVREFAGKMAKVRIVDDAKGGWGHLNVDHIVQTNIKPPGLLTDAERPFVAHARYLISRSPMFSGSAVVDWHNTSHFGKDGKPPLVLIYTAAGNPTVQSLAV